MAPAIYARPGRGQGLGPWPPEPPDSAMVAQAPCSAMSPGTGTALEAFCVVTLSL